MRDQKEAVLEKRRDEDRSQEFLKKGWYHSFNLPGIGVIDGIISLEDLEKRWASMPLPADLTGKRVLDIGTWDGWCAFEAERRGASVVAVDCVEQENFQWLHRKLGSRVSYQSPRFTSCAICRSAASTTLSFSASCITSATRFWAWTSFAS